MISFASGSRFIDGLNGLKRQVDPLDLRRLTVPLKADVHTQILAPSPNCPSKPTPLLAVCVGFFDFSGLVGLSAISLVCVLRDFSRLVRLWFIGALR